MGGKNRTKLDKAIYGLRSLIMSGDFSKGQRLSEVAVAEQLNISRTPLRQAMDRLVAEGLLERIPTGGCRVATFAEQDIADAIELRGVMEGTAARLAAERGVEPALLEQAADALDLIDIALGEKANFGFDQYVEQNAIFHKLLAQFPASPMIAREIERINRLPLASPSAFLVDHSVTAQFRDSLHYGQRQHRALLDAIIHREGTRAEAIAREHARLALLNIEYVNAPDDTGANVVAGLNMVATANT